MLNNNFHFLLTLFTFSATFNNHISSQSLNAAPAFSSVTHMLLILLLQKTFWIQFPMLPDLMLLEIGCRVVGVDDVTGVDDFTGVMQVLMVLQFLLMDFLYISPYV